jgi:REP element-mobilizing transposase RayT
VRELRDTCPDKIHVLSCRTAGSEILFVPRPELNQIIGGVIAKYQEQHGIIIYAVTVLSNHYHLLAQAPKGNLPLFFENTNREIAHRVNRYLGRKGFVWGRRYDDLVAIEDEDALEALLYIVSNAVKHGLVEHPKHWPGICSYWQSLGQQDKKFTFTNFSQYHRARAKAQLRGDYVRVADFQTTHTLKITPLTCLSRIATKISTALPKLLDARIDSLVRQRKAEGKEFLGRKALLAQPLQGTFPKETNNTNRPICYSKNPDAIRVAAEDRKVRRAWYTDASIAFRSLRFDAVFPPFCLFPPLHHPPKQRSHPT